MKIKFAKRVRKKLAEIGFLTKLEGRRYIHAKSKFELPCDLSDCDLGENPIEIGAYSYIGRGTKIYSPVKIGRFCSIAEDVKIGLHSHPIDRFSTSPFFYHENWNGWNEGKNIVPFEPVAKVEIGDDVWICAGVMIKGGVKIGNGAVIACGAVLTKDVPAFEKWGGIPAVKIGERKIQQQYAHEYENLGILTQKDFAQFLPIKKKIKNWLKNYLTK